MDQHNPYHPLLHHLEKRRFCSRSSNDNDSKWQSILFQLVRCGTLIINASYCNENAQLGDQPEKPERPPLQPEGTRRRPRPGNPSESESWSEAGWSRPPRDPGPKSRASTPLPAMTIPGDQDGKTQPETQPETVGFSSGRFTGCSECQLTRSCRDLIEPSTSLR